MIVGVPRETYPGERRVALVPAVIPNLVKAGLQVVIEAGAGVEAGFPDSEYGAKGAKILEPLGVKAVERIVRHHHERYDGTGYPDGLAGDEIPLGARIVAVADSFEDMVSDLAYKKRRTFGDAIAEFRRCSGSQFDPDVVAVFLEWVNIHGDPRENESDESKVA